jgi:predicted transcriptional regulator of viral defense system
MALKYYGFIPEEIFQVTSVATRKTVQFETPVGSFAYRHLKPSLFWGYRLVDFGKQMILIADPEKAILDSLYLRTNLKTVDDFLGMRINTDEFRRHIDGEKLQRYLKAFGNKQLEKRVRTFLMSLENDNS